MLKLGRNFQVLQCFDLALFRLVRINVNFHIIAEQLSKSGQNSSVHIGVFFRKNLLEVINTQHQTQIRNVQPREVVSKFVVLRIVGDQNFLSESTHQIDSSQKVLFGYLTIIGPQGGDGYLRNSDDVLFLVAYILSEVG